ncbi:MAG TPA: GNAT family N-acetyltransferase [Candidatus Krumholzibacterium sp.]|nr:GNAT family N-acetyltransferase [Candidatus Krumholzibacterium sp.]
MEIEFRNLDDRSKPEVYRTFVEAFSDYELDMSHMSEKNTWNRAAKNRIDLSASVGAFAGERMVGYTLVGIDEWKGGIRYAYDIMTGIVKEFRGKGIARGMFAHIRPGLKERGVERFALEVLQGNDRAIRAYKKAGFGIVREFDCYQFDLEAWSEGEHHGHFRVSEADVDILDRFAGELDWEPSWENSFNAVRAIPDEVLVLSAWMEGVEAGILVYYPALKWIMTLLTRRGVRRKGVGSALLDSLVGRVGSPRLPLRLVNADHSDDTMAEFLSRHGFERFVGQYEMEMVL